MASSIKMLSLVLAILSVMNLVLGMPSPKDSPAQAEKGDLRTAGSYGFGYGYGYPYTYGGLYGYGYGYGYPYYGGYYGAYGYPFYG